MASEEEPVRENVGTLDSSSLIAEAVGNHERYTTDTNFDGTVASTGSRLGPRLRAMVQAARYHGVELDANDFRPSQGEAVPSPAALALWAQNCGLWARAVRLRWRHLLRLNDAGPVVLLFKDGSAGLLTGADTNQMAVFVKNPEAPLDTAPIAVDELRLSQVWTGEAILLRASRGTVAADAPFNLRWLVDLVLQEHRSLRDIAIASLTISILTIFPPLPGPWRW